MRTELEIRVAQMRDALNRLGSDLSDLVTDAYALGRLDGLREARESEDA